MNVCCCPPVPGCDLGDVCGICWGRARTHCPARDPPAGFSFGKGFLSSRAHVQALLPQLPWLLRPGGASQGLHRSCSTHTAPAGNQGWVSHLIPAGTLLPAGLTEKLLLLNLIPSFLPQALGGAAVCPSLHQCQQLGQSLSKGMEPNPRAMGSCRNGAGEELILLCWAEGKLGHWDTGETWPRNLHFQSFGKCPQ